jgi:gamma-glutamyl:cysteine ligase YbdK (ATP-grasp superfamily)
MGQEIGREHFQKHDFLRFSHSLKDETNRLAEWFSEQAFASGPAKVGFELEACLIDSQYQPAPVNEAFLDGVNDRALFSPELSRFNIELNSQPMALHRDILSRLADGMRRDWQYGQQVAAQLDARLVMIGILPTLQESMLSLQNMSAMTRYRALNEQVLRLRGGRALELDILGDDHLKTSHGDVMLEAATTSFQLHLEADQNESVRLYNVLQILSAPLVAISANSPLLFGKRLWHETRIPLFEQAVAVGGIAGASPGPLRRVSFGSGYARHSLLEVFEENARHFPLLLPVVLEEEADRLPHLRLHNGTIWRWNRPLIGFERDGRPHLRIEHRVIPAGPTVVDSIANAALLFGLAHVLVHEAEVEKRLEFGRARDNFYAAARHGTNAQVHWLDGRHGRMGELLLQLLPLAREGLLALQCDRAEVDYYLGIIAARLETGQTGANWQRQAFERHGGDLRALVAEYFLHQERGEPVHRW